jgi:hypothetical protein
VASPLCGCNAPPFVDSGLNVIIIISFSLRAPKNLSLTWFCHVIGSFSQATSENRTIGNSTARILVQFFLMICQSWHGARGCRLAKPHHFSKF